MPSQPPMLPVTRAKDTMQRYRRKAACDPCRTSKLACDHEKPTCARCRNRNKAGQCVYRPAPFRKTKAPPANGSPRDTPVQCHDIASVGSPALPVSIDQDQFGPGPLPRYRLYPNPGYLGSSSHTALFGQLGEPGADDATGALRAVSEAHISHGAQLLDQLCHSLDIPVCLRLVELWLETGANLCLAAPFTLECSATVRSLLLTKEGIPSMRNLAVARALFTHSSQSLKATSETTADSFAAQFNQENARWETLCLFLVGVSRATISSRVSEELLSSGPQRRRVRRLAMHFSDRCLEICLSLDYLNDLQLVLMFENFILHTLVDGDQSFDSWRKLGDLSSALFALGYHQAIEGPAPAPAFLRRIRQAAFGNSYSADKNVSIFLGRPPRILGSFCSFTQPGLEAYFSNAWEHDTPLEFDTEARWSAMCAVLKEEIMIGRFGAEKRFQDLTQRASRIHSDVAAQWAALPDHFRLEAPMKSYDISGVQLDLMLGIKLNHLHVLFLLHLALVRTASEPDFQLVASAKTMLNLVVEALMVKERLVHSSTSLAWKVVYYGLAAAGVICLSLLHQLPDSENGSTANASTLRELGVLVMEVDYGTLVHDEDANYALLAGAARTIRNILDRVSFSRREATAQTTEVIGHQPIEVGNWDPWNSGHIQDFDFDFWHTLAEHPILLSNSMEQI